MGISRYLALTGEELEAAPSLFRALPAYMACHFSPYGTGLSDPPQSLPPGSMLILNDRIPIRGHDPKQITAELEALLGKWRCGCLLLDFQRPGSSETERLCRALVSALSVPVGVSDHYAGSLSCPVFLPPPLPVFPPARLQETWPGRELWLDAAPSHCAVTVTARGAAEKTLPWTSPPEDCFSHPGLHCRYRQEVSREEIRFFLWRGLAELDALAESLGITRTVGLYQDYLPGTQKSSLP